MVLDAIDIDSTGYLVPLATTSNLVAAVGDSGIDLSWIASSEATSFNIKRSITPGGPYTTIGTSTETQYKDIDLIAGTTYYYVVTAVDNGVESANSNEASATIYTVNTNHFILEITMTNGSIKTYDLTNTEFNTFLNWYDNRSNGTDKSYYVFTKKSDIRPFISKKEYIVFDKISSFEVKEYTE